MLKIRMQGMTSDIEWFQKILEEDKIGRASCRERV